MTPADSAELVLGPATRLMWRGPDTVHLELGSRAVLVEGVTAGVVRQIAARPGGAEPRPPLDPAVRHALVVLAEAGYLWPRPGDIDDLRRSPPVPRLAPELNSLAVRHGEQAAVLLSARRHSSVAVHGSSRVAPHLAAILAAAGVGRVHCAASGDVRLAHTVPGGLTPGDEGSGLAPATDAAIRRAAPETDTTALPVGQPADLTILALEAPLDDERRDALHAAGAAHLAVVLGSDYGVIGPLVLPGLTSCLRCADLHRRDRDPAWAALAVQLTITSRPAAASDTAVATIIAGTAALQALTFLDGGEPACIDGTLELRRPDWRLRRRTWPAHPDCDCAGPT